MAKVTVQIISLSMSSAIVILRYRMHAYCKSTRSNKVQTQAWDSWSLTRSLHSTSSIMTIPRHAIQIAHLGIIMSITSATNGRPQVDSTAITNSSNN